MPRWLIITLSIMGLCLLSLLSGAVVEAIRVQNGRGEPAAAEKCLDRDEFKKAVWVHGPDYVIRKVGRPDRTRTTHDHDQIWYYDGRVRDPISGRLGNARIRMALGNICDEVDFD